MATALITGANRGIGLEFCRQLQARGDKVIAVCRSDSAELEATGVRVERNIDVTDDRSTEKLAAALGDIRLDLLVNNAGILQRTPLDELDFDVLRAQFEVNALGPLRVTRALLSHMAPHSRIALITSRMGSITDNTSGGSYGYRMSKAALNIAGKSLAHDLAARHISVALLHPGHVKTDMTGHTGNSDPKTAVADLLQRIDELTLATSGTFWHANGEILPW
ncbi:MAG: SDR family oxidoreductase [Gammaproteobacteria bacterium]|nr:SDR family oxidoreductase [Gammaproteobacteria bacterium]MDH3466326.1 SDR family oxidoreductase [Gammaproteobacteria bacterium]